MPRKEPLRDSLKPLPGCRSHPMQVGFSLHAIQICSTLNRSGLTRSVCPMGSHTSSMNIAAHIRARERRISLQQRQELHWAVAERQPNKSHSDKTQRQNRDIDSVESTEYTIGILVSRNECRISFLVQATILVNITIILARKCSLTNTISLN
jgi:hypothetical protein